MKKTISSFYKDISDMLSIEHGVLLKEFEIRTKKDAPKEVFLWLNKELEGKPISLKLEELLTDFFFSIH